MIQQSIKFALIFAVIILLTSCSASFYIVRHAEKANSSPDTPLSAAGQARAVSLKDSLAGKDISRIFVTNYQRTQQTAAPLAAELGITPTEIFANQTGELIRQLRGINNTNTLIVGHSNTVPVIIDSLMRSPQNITIQETDFDNLFKVKISRATSVVRRFTRSTYGQPTN